MSSTKGSVCALAGSRALGNFRRTDLQRYNVLVFPPAFGGAGSYRNALGERGLATLEGWIEGGGTVIGIGGGAQFLADTGTELTTTRLRRQADRGLSSGRPRGGGNGGPRRRTDAGSWVVGRGQERDPPHSLGGDPAGPGSRGAAVCTGCADTGSHAGRIGGVDQAGATGEPVQAIRGRRGGCRRTAPVVLSTRCPGPGRPRQASLDELGSPGPDRRSPQRLRHLCSRRRCRSGRPVSPIRSCFTSVACSGPRRRAAWLTPATRRESARGTARSSSLSTIRPTGPGPLDTQRMLLNALLYGPGLGASWPVPW